MPALPPAVTGMPASPAELPLISVALCVYNGERYLGEQLESLLAQEGVRLEIVCVDDRSTDGSLALLQDYATRDARFRVFENETNLGHLRSFEKCMALCSGDFIAPCDQDDVWHPQKLSRLLAAIGDADLAYCDSAYVDEDGSSLGGRISDDLTMMAGHEPFQFVFVNSVSGHASLVRRSLFERARPFPPGIYHDWWLAMCAAGGNGLVYLDEALVQFRRHGNAVTALGKGDKPVPPSKNRLWLRERRTLLAAFAASQFDDRERGARLLQALDQAANRQGSWPLLRALWRERRAAPPWKGFAAINVLRLHSRFLRKLKRARDEPEPTPPFSA